MHSLQRSIRNVSQQSLEGIWDGLLVLKLAHLDPSKRLHSPLPLVRAAMSSSLRKFLPKQSTKWVWNTRNIVQSSQLWFAHFVI